MIFNLAYGGDITCDFESSDWNNGHCNWQYSFLSKNILTRFYEKDESDTKNKYGN